MDRELLEGYLDGGLSLTEIGALTNRDPSTVGYWVQKHGLTANGRAKFAPRGGLTREQLEPLVETGGTLQEIADALDRNVSTVRHWLAKHQLRTKSRRGRRHFDGPKPKLIVDDCPRHGETEFILEGRGAYRCKRCRSNGVSERRRRVKRILVEEAGGKCILCGYNKHPAALEFHHLDPTTKQFAVSRRGITRAIGEVRKEAQKCVLVCANCHAEVEVGAAELPVK